MGARLSGLSTSRRSCSASASTCSGSSSSRSSSGATARTTRSSRRRSSGSTTGSTSRSLGIDFSINKAVLYLVLASAATIAMMVLVARNVQRRPNLTQMAVEIAFNLVDGQITNDNLDKQRAIRWFPWLATSFFFILFSNIIGLIPLPTNTEATDRHLRPRAARLRALRGDGEHLGAADPRRSSSGSATTRRASASTGSSATSPAGCPPASRRCRWPSRPSCG